MSDAVFGPSRGGEVFHGGETPLLLSPRALEGEWAHDPLSESPPRRGKFAKESEEHGSSFQTAAPSKDAQVTEPQLALGQRIDIAQGKVVDKADEPDEELLDSDGEASTFQKDDASVSSEGWSWAVCSQSDGHPESSEEVTSEVCAVRPTCSELMRVVQGKEKDAEDERDEEADRTEETHTSVNEAAWLFPDQEKSSFEVQTFGIESGANSVSGCEFVADVHQLCAEIVNDVVDFVLRTDRASDGVETKKERPDVSAEESPSDTAVCPEQDSTLRGLQCSTAVVRDSGDSCGDQVDQRREKPEEEETCVSEVHGEVEPRHNHKDPLPIDQTAHQHDTVAEEVAPEDSVCFADDLVSNVPHDLPFERPSASSAALRCALEETSADQTHSTPLICAEPTDSEVSVQCEHTALERGSMPLVQPLTQPCEGTHYDSGVESCTHDVGLCRVPCDGFVGTWRHSWTGRYEINEEESGFLRIIEIHEGVVTQGDLVLEGPWLEAVMFDKYGRAAGAICLYLRESGKELVSKFMKEGAVTWGREVVARRVTSRRVAALSAGRALAHAGRGYDNLGACVHRFVGWAETKITTRSLTDVRHKMFPSMSRKDRVDVPLLGATEESPVAEGASPAPEAEDEEFQQAVRNDAALQHAREVSSAAARARLEKVMVMYHAKLHPVMADGNCQFRALSAQLYGEEDYHKAVRSIIVQELVASRELYESHVYEPFDDYVARLGRDGEWGDNVTLQAVSNALGVDVMVLTDQLDSRCVEIRPVVPVKGPPQKPLYLAFVSEVHYDAAVVE